MNGMIFAAGLGTRLRPLTNDRPKALVELKRKTLLERVVERMREVQVERLVINIHHFADQVELFLKEKGDFGMDIVLSDERDELLDTGGGVLKARELFIPGEPVLIHNVDILTDLDLIFLIWLQNAKPMECRLHLEIFLIWIFSVHFRNSKKFLKCQI